MREAYIHRNYLYSFALFVFDLFAYYLSLYLAYVSRVFVGGKFKDIIPQFNADFFDLIKLFWMPIILIVFIIYEGLYSNNHPYQEELRKVIRSIMFSFVTVFFVVGLAKLQHSLSRLLIIFLFFYLLLLLSILRLVIKPLLYRLRFGARTLLLVGFLEERREDIEKMLNDVYLGYVLIGIISKNKGFVNLGNYRYKLRPMKLVRRINLIKDVHTVAIIQDGISYQELRTVIINAQKIAKEILIIPSIRTYSILNLEVMPIYYPQFLIFRFKDNLKSSINTAIKNLFDYTIAIILIPFAALLGLLIYILVRLDSPGPGIITHERIGKGGKSIKVYKFRTMHINADAILKDLLTTNENIRREWEEKRKIKNDPRVTRLGRFLRKTSLDELPQLINVLKGEMSLVGPRPVTKEELERYYGEFASLYLQVKPGITGFWQVSGRSRVDYEVRVAMDVFYILNWSLWLDFFILLKTVWVVLRGEGAH